MAELACTLTPQALKERRSYVRKTILPRVSSSTSLPDGLDVRFHKLPDTADLLAEFVSLEQSCCGFLTFRIEPAGNEVQLSIRGPREAEGTLEMFRKALT